MEEEAPGDYVLKKPFEMTRTDAACSAPLFRAPVLGARWTHRSPETGPRSSQSNQVFWEERADNVI